MRNNMFQYAHLLSKIIALVFCIKESTQQIQLATQYPYAYTYKKIRMHITIHTCARTYIASVDIWCALFIMWEFYLSVLHNS